MVSLGIITICFQKTKKYKAFAKEVDNFQKVLKKKGATTAFDEFAVVESALNEWLSEIDLPAAREL